MGVGQNGPPVRSATGRSQPNQALEPTPYSVRCAPASGRGSPRPNNSMKRKSRCAGLRFASLLGWAAARTRAPAQVGVPLI